MTDFELPDEKIEMTVDPGVCRFKAIIKVRTEADTLHVSIESSCPHVMEFADKVKVLGAFDALKMPFSQNVLFVKGGESLKHSACPIPTAVIKCAEACAGFALKKDVKYEFAKG